MWGSVGIEGGAIAVINEAEFRYGGGLIDTPTFSIPSQSVLAFMTPGSATCIGFPTPPTASVDSGTHVYITNNDFFDNLDAAMQIEPNGLLAGDPLHPLGLGPSVLPRQRDAGQRHRRPGRRHLPSYLDQRAQRELHRPGRGRSSARAA